jgi:tRNA(His) 5'-end guanylyltransferase
VCKNVQGCKFAFVQSDEISLVLTDFDTPTTDAFFSNRLCKMQSIIASLATAKFNQLMASHHFDKMWDEGYAPDLSVDNICNKIEELPLYQFDCKCWNVPTYNDVFAWILYRQNDCIKNSKQQTAQTYLPHKELLGKNTDEQIALLKETQGVDWHEFPNDKKYGRFIWKEEVQLVSDDGYQYTRHMWKTHDAYPLNDEHNRDIFHSMNIIPKQ